MNIEQLLQLAVTAQASDLHLTAGSPPLIRTDGRLRSLPGAGSLSRQETKELVYSILSDSQIKHFESYMELDFSANLKDITRMRVNVHSQRGSIEAALRLIPSKIQSLKELGVPNIAGDLARKPNGLVLVTGPTGSGKSTTMAALVELINSERNCNIVTIENPIEFNFSNKKAVIKQREVGKDTFSFANALKAALRQDPVVIMIGEMRDLETISTAITAAETGHLVLSTLHTSSAPQTIDRIIDVFSDVQKQHIMTQLAGCLRGVISQQLLPRADGTGRVLACEVLIKTTAAAYCIKTHQTQQLESIIQTGAKYGMISMDRSLKQLQEKGIIANGKSATYNNK